MGTFGDLCSAGVTLPWHRYVTAAAVKAMQRVEDAQTEDDTKFESAAERASEVMDLFCGRHFAIHVETKRFDAPHCNSLDLAGEDLLALTTVTNGDESSITTSYLLGYPLGSWPKRFLRPKPALAYFTNGTLGYVEITGLWGYHDNPIGAWRSVGTLASNLTAASTTLVLSSLVGMETLMIDDEQIGVDSTAIVSGAKTATIVRGVNGTTAAAHTSGRAIYQYYPATAVQHAALLLAGWLYHRPDAPFETVGTPGGMEAVVPADMPADIRKLLLALRAESYA